MINLTIEGGTSKRLLTAGKYCADDILVTAEGGGGVNAITASSLPGTVTDGQIVVITDVAVPHIYVNTDEPANPVEGDVWVKLEAGADVAVETSEKSPYMGGGLAYAGQWAGNSYMPCAGYLGVAGTWQKFAAALPPVGTPLNDCTWDEISAIAAAGLADRYWTVGDAKQITINGKVGITTFSNYSIWAYIIGINHNAEIEGSNKIHFQLAKTAQTGGKDLCFTDSRQGTYSNPAGSFALSHSWSNSGGWASSPMRSAILGSDAAPDTPAADTFMAALPYDLRNVMKPCTKYTDNQGGSGDTASKVTATTEYLWLPAEFEILGNRNQANSAEKNYQAQYAYYSAGNSPIKYRQTDYTAALWFTRSVRAGSTSAYCVMQASGGISYYDGIYSQGIAPCFCV